MAAAALPFIQAGLSLGSAIVGDAQAKRARRAATSIERQRLGLATRLQDRYFDAFVPLQDRAIALASRPIDPNAEAAAAGADVQHQAGIQQQIALRNLARNGISPDSPAAVDANMRLGLGTALGRAAAMTSARRGARREELGNLMTVSNMGAPLLGQASAGLADVGAARSARADGLETLQGQAWAGAGADIASLIDSFSKSSPASSSGGSPGRWAPP